MEKMSGSKTFLLIFNVTNIYAIGILISFIIA